MKQFFYILISLIILISCTNTRKSTKIQFSEEIIGDWKTDYFLNRENPTAFIFTFQDSLCSYLYPWGEFSDYRLNLDTLIIQDYKSKGNKEKYKFLIDSLNDNILYLRPINLETKKLFDRYEKETYQPIKLSKIDKKEDWKINRVGFFSTGCLGSCPSMYLEIDSLGNILFNGESFTEKEGLYKGKLSKEKLDLLYTKIRNIQLDSLKKHYSANWTDDQTCGIKIETEKQLYQTSAYGFNKEPIELRILFHWLMELHKDIELKKDSTIEKKFKYDKFKYLGIPIPPPPPFPGK